jgi:hypothetical protein
MNCLEVIALYLFFSNLCIFKRICVPIFELRLHPNTWKLNHQPIFSHIKTAKSISLCTDLRKESVGTWKVSWEDWTWSLEFWNDEVWALLEWCSNGGSYACMRQGRFDIIAHIGHVHLSQINESNNEQKNTSIWPVADLCVVLLHAELLIHASAADTMNGCILSDEDAVQISKGQDAPFVIYKCWIKQNLVF